jgi:hypothetical protein
VQPPVVMQHESEEQSPSEPQVLPSLQSGEHDGGSQVHGATNVPAM